MHRIEYAMCHNEQAIQTMIEKDERKGRHLT